MVDVNDPSRTDDEEEVTEAPSEEPGPGRRRVAPGLIVIAAVIAVTGIVAYILAAATAPESPTEAPEAWDSLSYESDQDIAQESIDLEERRGLPAQVIVHAAEETCWNGYVGSEAINGCGRGVYDVSNAPVALGLNVRSESDDDHFVGLAVWDGAGDTKLHSLETKKPFGTLAVTVNL